MSNERDKEIVYRPLYESPIVSVHDYCCHIAQGGPGGEEISDANNIVLMRHGAFSRHFGRRTFTADVNQAVFFSRESTYRVSHPADCGDRGTVFTVAPRVLNAKTYLASRMSERITLDEVARAVHASPFHLARIFQQQTGVPVHRYLTQLRLRASLERLAGGASDLTALALELGFSSHSHFTDAFRREFGKSPSELRRK